MEAPDSTRMPNGWPAAWTWDARWAIADGTALAAPAAVKPLKATVCAFWMWLAASAAVSRGKESSPFRVLERVVEIERILRRAAVVHHGADRLDHGHGMFGLEDVAAHVHARGALLDGL